MTEDELIMATKFVEAPHDQVAHLKPPSRDGPRNPRKPRIPSMMALSRATRERVIGAMPKAEGGDESRIRASDSEN